MAKGLRLLLGVLTLFILSGSASVSYAAPAANRYSSTLKSAPLKSAGQIATDLSDEDVLQTGFNFQQQPNHSPDLQAEAVFTQRAGLRYAVLIQAPQISSIYKLLYYRFLLYPFHAFW
jgi:hypothetical protein